MASTEQSTYEFYWAAQRVRGEELSGCIRPGPNDFRTRPVSGIRDGDFLEEWWRPYSPVKRIPVADIVPDEEAEELVRENVDEGFAMVRSVEEGLGNEPDDGHGRVEVRLTVGQLRRLVAMMRQHAGVKP